MSLSSVSVRRRISFLMLFIFIVGVGFFGLTQLGIDLYPKVQFPMIIIMSSMTGAGPEEMENLVTRNLEEAASRVASVKKITSTSVNGVSVVMAEFDWGHDLEQAETDIRRQLDLYGELLPEDATDPLVLALDPSLQPVMFIGFSSSQLDDFALRQLLENEIEPRLTRQPGVGSVSTMGGLVREIQIQADPARMEAAGVTLSQITGAIASVRNDMPAGELEAGGLSMSIRVESSVAGLSQLEQLVVGGGPGGPVLLRDVADVVDGEQEVTQYIRMDGQPSLFGIVQRRSDANTVNVCNSVNRELEAIEREYAGQLVPYVMFDQSDFISQAISNLANTAVQASVLAFLVLLFFLRSPRGALIAGAAIPVSIITTFAVMHFTDVDLNMISLAGLALAVGLLVDNSIVVLESIYRYRTQGENPCGASVNGSSEVAMAISASTLTTLAVFVPILFVPGIAGEMFREMVLTIVFSLIVSLFVALSLVPLLSSFADRLVPVHRQGSLGWRIQNWFESSEKKFRNLAATMVKHRKKVILITLAVLVATLAMTPLLKTEFIPSNDEGFISIEMSAPLGTSLDETDALIRALEDSLPQIFAEGDLITWYSQVGQEQGIGAAFSGAGGSWSAEMMFRLVPVHQRSTSQKEYEERIRGVLDHIPGLEYDISGGNFMGGSPIEVEIFSDDMETLVSEGERFREVVAAIPGVREAKSSMEDMTPELSFSPDVNSMALYGLSPYTVGSEIGTALRGTEAGVFREAGEEISIVVRYPEYLRDSREDLDYLSVAGLPALNLGDFRERMMSTSIRRTNQQRSVTITCDVVGRSLGEVASDVRRAVEDANYNHLRIEFGGDMKDQQETFLYLGIAIVVAALLVYMVMCGEFESLLEPFIIIFTVPMAIIGVVLGLLITGTSLSVMSLIGVLMLAGIVVNNGIVLVDYANQILRRGGRTIEEAVTEAVTVRLRPILMTALTTILAMFPLALGIGEGAESWAPLAVTVIFGMIAATGLTLLVEPCIYVVFGHRLAMKARKECDAAG
jgi:HAE1 family hydrophobic/amphiphilic exporter-1